jgi:hypothetical protein
LLKFQHPAGLTSGGAFRDSRPFNRKAVTLATRQIKRHWRQYTRGRAISGGNAHDEAAAAPFDRRRTAKQRKIDLYVHKSSTFVHANRALRIQSAQIADRFCELHCAAWANRKERRPLCIADI